MKRSFRQFAIFCLALLGNTAINAQTNNCPDINNIKAIALDFVLEYKDGVFWVATHNNYDTDSNWLFSIAPIKADFGGSAIRKANAILQQMNSPGIPEQDNDEYECFYATGQDGVYASALLDNDLTHRHANRIPRRR